MLGGGCHAGVESPFLFLKTKCEGCRGAVKSLAEIHSSYLGRSLKVCVKKVMGRWLSSSSLRQQRRPSL